MHDREGAEQMEMIYNWILKLSFFAVLGSVILQMIPDHGFQKYVRFVLGLILAAMLVVPAKCNCSLFELNKKYSVINTFINNTIFLI